jgi:hypothetical protein
VGITGTCVSRLGRRIWVGRRSLRLLLVAGLVILAAGCETSHHAKIAELKRTKPNPNVLLMPLDVELTELSAGGVQEPKAEWTAAARTHMLTALRAEKEVRGLRIVEYRVPESNHSESDLHVQLAKLHRAVARAALMHGLQELPIWRLPAKKDKLDWTLGPKVAALKQGYDADYALFVYVRDSYTSGERAVAIVVAALLGVSIHGGVQVGFATLVDLNTGDIVWINRLARNSGDLRTPEPATETVKTLLTGIPK